MNMFGMTKGPNAQDGSPVKPLFFKCLTIDGGNIVSWVNCPNITDDLTYLHKDDCYLYLVQPPARSDLNIM